MKKLILLSLLLTSAAFAQSALPAKVPPQNIPGMITVTKDANGNTVLSTSDGVIATEKKGVNGTSTLTSKDGVLDCKNDAKGNMVCNPK